MPRIERIKFSRGIVDDGLGDIEMKDLGPVVLLAGPNGAGKTRLINRVGQVNRQGPRAQLVERERDLSLRVVQLGKRATTDGGVVAGALVDAQRELSQVRTDIASMPEVGPYEDRPMRCHVGPTTLRPANDTKDGERRGLPEGLSSGWKVGSLSNEVLPYIRELADRCALSSSSTLHVVESDRAAARERFETFRDVCRTMLGFAPDIGLHPRLTVDKRDLDEAGLSPGQSTLLQLAVRFHAQGTHVRGQVLLFDEPEQHLHPRSLLEVFEALIKAVGDDGQLWVATHSVHLLAHVDPKSIWFMDKGTVSRAGSSVTKVLEGLVGEQEEVEKLARFLLLPAEHAAILFATQSLGAPGVAGPKDNDPQPNQIRTMLERLREERGGKLRMLDYGAGIGRLLDHLHARDPKAGEHYDYLGFEPDDSHRADLVTTLSRLNVPTSNALDAKKLGSLQYGGDKVDVVVMCNVVHEIDPQEWPEVFDLVAAVLKADGYLLIVEDQLLPVGERAHGNGFVVLGEVATTALFGCGGAAGFTFGYEVHNNEPARLSAALIPRAKVSGVTHARGGLALTEVRKASRSELSRLETKAKGKKADLKDGRAYAFHTFQFANATRALEKSCFAGQTSAPTPPSSDAAE